MKFSNSSLNAEWFSGLEPFPADDRVFGLNFDTCLEKISTTECPGGQATFQEEYWIRTTDLIAQDTWLKSIDIGDVYVGNVVFDLFAPLPLVITTSNELVFSSSVSACFDNLADYEMGGEICGQHGQPWTITVTNTDQIIPVTVYPAFGMGETGNSSVLLPHFYSSQFDFDNYRDIPVYTPPPYVKTKSNAESTS